MLSKFHVNIIIVSDYCFLFIGDFTRNPEIANTLVWVLPDIWILELVRDTKFDRNIPDGKLQIMKQFSQKSSL